MTGLRANASSSSRSRDTPARRFRNLLAPQLRQISGRRVPHCAHTSSLSASWVTAASQASQCATSPHDAQANRRERPFRLSTHTTRASPRTRRANSSDNRGAPGGSSRRSTTCNTGQPVRSSSRDTVTSSPHCKASSVGAGDTSVHATPARRALSITTSRACHVGADSCCHTSSCSSISTTDRSSAYGRPRRRTRAHHGHLAAAHRRPFVGIERGSYAVTAQLAHQPLCGDERGHQDQGASPRMLDDEVVGRRGRRKPHDGRARFPDEPREPTWSQVGHVAVRRGSTQEMRRCAGPSPGRPVGQLDQLGRRPEARHLGDRLELDTGRGFYVVGHDPTADASPVQLDPHHRSQLRTRARSSGGTE